MNNVWHSKGEHNLDIMHLGCCTKCGGAKILPYEPENTQVESDIDIAAENYLNEINSELASSV